MRQKLGEGRAKIVQCLLFTLDAAPSLADLSISPPIFRKEVNNYEPPHFSVGTPNKGQVIFRPIGNYSPESLSKIDCIEIMNLEGNTL